MRKSVVSIILAVVGLSGCASMGLSDLFTSYHTQMNASRQATLNQHYVEAIEKLPDYQVSHNSYVLSKLESGRLRYLAGDWDGSREEFETALALISEQNNEAKYRISTGLSNVGSVLSNDNVLPYVVPLYEQSMLHSMQAMNYLFENKLESALVEVRRANLVQEQALLENQRSLEEARTDLKNEGMDVSRLYAAYPDMSGVIGTVKNSFQNGYTFYLSGLLYELNGDFNDAYIDYKKALEITPENTYIQQDVWRLANELGMSDEVALLNADLGESVKSTERRHDKSGEVVLLIEQSVVQNRQSVSLNLPVFTRHDDMRFFSFSLPVYRSQALSTPLRLTANEHTFESQNVVHVQSLAAKALKDELPWLLGRQVVRVVAKEEMRRKMSKEGGDIGNIVASLYNISTEKADTRSWSLLPSNVQILRMSLPVGQQTIRIMGHQQSYDLLLDVKNNSYHLLNIVDIGNELQVREKTVLR